MANKKSCIKCKHSELFFDFLSCENKKTMKEKQSTWGDYYVNMYGWKHKLCNRYKKG